MISTGAVTYLAEIHPEESDLHRQRRECQIELASVKAVLTRIQSDKLQAIQQIEELAQKRAADALAEYREGGPKSDGSELRKTRDALVDLGAAESQAIQEIARLESEIKIRSPSRANEGWESPGSTRGALQGDHGRHR